MRTLSHHKNEVCPNAEINTVMAVDDFVISFFLMTLFCALLSLYPSSASLRCGTDGYRLANWKLLLCWRCGRPSVCLQQKRSDLCDSAGPRSVQPQRHCLGPGHGVCASFWPFWPNITPNVLRSPVEEDIVLWSDELLTKQASQSQITSSKDMKIKKRLQV